MKKIIVIVLIGILAACNNSVLITDTEVDAVQSVLDFYGGICNRHKGFETKDGEKQTYFTLEMSESRLLDNYSEILEMPASNIAFLFYSNLNSEKDNYTHVKVKINLSNGESYEYKYSVVDLNEILRLTPILQEASNYIKAQNYQELLSLFETDIASTISPSMLKNYCEPYDSIYGLTKHTQFQGYALFTSEKDQRELVQLGGIMTRKKENTAISLFIDRKSMKVVNLKYEF